MKIVKEKIFEKFTEDSDPISDMGIGAPAIIKNWVKKLMDLDLNLSDNLQISTVSDTRQRNLYYDMDTKEVSNDSGLYKGKLKIGKDDMKSGILRDCKISKVDDALMIGVWSNAHIDKNYNIIDKQSYIENLLKETQLYDFLRLQKVMPHDLIYKIKPTYLKYFKESLFEKFTEDSDPITDMGIGTRPLISKWMKEIGKKDTDDKALIQCSKAGKTEWVKFLLDRGADVHVDGDHALSLASNNGHTEIVKVLLDRGADVHADDDLSLRWASEKGHIEVVKLLLDAGADVHADNDAALQWASINGHTEVVKLLLDAGADVHSGNDYALRQASENGHIEVVKFLLDRGADVHANYDYALQWASNNGYVEVVKILLDAGADVHVLALQLASENGHTEIVKILKDHIKNKVVKESLNEKFTEDSDPITDMGIGIKNLVKNLKNNIEKKDKELSKDLRYEGIQSGKWNMVKDLTNRTGIITSIIEKDGFIKFHLYGNEFYNENLKKINKVSYIKKILKELKVLFMFNSFHHKEAFGHKCTTYDCDIIMGEINTDYLKYFKEYLNEAFTEESDPIHDMGIGINHIFRDLSKKIKSAQKRIGSKYYYFEDGRGSKRYLNDGDIIRRFSIESDKLIVYFYVDQFMKNGKIVDKVEHVKKVFKLISIDQFLDFEKSNFTGINEYVMFKINPQYTKYFEEQFTVYLFGNKVM